ncbi:MAG: cell division protein FtsQ/DivIB [Myxococcaceae bacterium]
MRLFILAAASAGAFFGGSYGYDWARTSPTFGIKRVTFTGLSHAAETDLLKLAGLGPGQNLVALDVAATEKAMQAHPWIKSVAISRHFPDSVSVKVVEHVPEAIVALGDLYLLDADGDPFKRVQAGDSLDLPLVSGIERDAYMKAPSESEQKFRGALEVVRAYLDSAAGKGTSVSEARIENEEVVLVLSGNGQEIRMGEGDVDQKLARLSQVKAELQKRGLVADVIHLDNRLRAGWVTVKLSAPGSSERKPGAQ